MSLKSGLSINEYLRKRLRKQIYTLPFVVSIIAGICGGLIYTLDLGDEQKNLGQAISSHVASLIETQDTSELQRFIYSVSQKIGITIDVVKGETIIVSTKNVSRIGTRYMDKPIWLFPFNLKVLGGNLTTRTQAYRPMGPNISSYIVIEKPLSDILIVSLLMGIVLFFGAYVLVKQISKNIVLEVEKSIAPVTELSAAVKKLTQFDDQKIELSADIKELNELKDTILLTQKSLKEANDAVSTAKAKVLLTDAYRSFIHDMSTPLSAMRQWLNHSLSAKSKQIKNEANAELFKISEQLLQLAHAAKENIGFDVKPVDGVDIRGTITDALDYTEMAFKENKKIKVHRNVLKEPSLVRHDPIMFSRAVTNILANAIEASRSKIRVSSKKEKGMFTFSVEDDGPGLSAAEASLFLQGRGQSSKSNRKGLGLSSANHIVRAHGGRILYENSKILKGAMFTIELKGVV